MSMIVIVATLSCSLICLIANISNYHRLGWTLDKSQLELVLDKMPPLHDDLSDDPPVGSRIALLVVVTLQRDACVGSSVESELSLQFIRNIMTSVGIRQTGHVSVRRVWKWKRLSEMNWRSNFLKTYSQTRVSVLVCWALRICHRCERWSKPCSSRWYTPRGEDSGCSRQSRDVVVAVAAGVAVVAGGDSWREDTVFLRNIQPWCNHWLQWPHH